MPSARAARVRRGAGAFARAAQAVLFTVGLLCLGVVAAAWIEAKSYQATQDEALRRALERGDETEERLDAPAAPPAGPSLPIDPLLIGRLDVPRLGLSALVREGEDQKTLKVALGHLPDTPLPWEPGNGNVAIAGHRDTFMRGLGEIRKDDELLLTTPRGRFAYRVDRIAVVRPDQVEILRSDDAPRLTLITCYPFSWTGPAPRRFIVKARRVD